MGFKMKGPSLYKPKMANMDIQKDYDKKGDDRAMSSPYQKNKGTLLPEVEVNEKKNTLKTKTIKNKDGSYTETRTKGQRSGSSTYRPTGKNNVYVNEQGQKRQYTNAKKA
tara:strand:- start:42 stop:371 length:330 start_codon:yes stop_codon:yes gene_type:complete